MNPAPDHFDADLAVSVPDAELQQQRDNVRRRLRHANLASILILLVVVTLAAGFVWQAQDAKQEAARAHRATDRAEEALWHSQFNEVRAERYTTHAGLFSASRDRIVDLAARPNLSGEQRLALRQEAIAQLASARIVTSTQSVAHSTKTTLVWNPLLDRYFDFRTNGTAAIIAHPSGEPAMVLPSISGSQPQAATFSPDGRLAAVRFHGGEVQVWDLGSKRRVLITQCARMPDDPAPLTFLPNNQALGMFTRQGFVLQSLDRADAQRLLQKGRHVGAVSITPDSKFMAVCPDDSPNSLEIWDLATGAVVLKFAPDFRPTSVEWHPDGRRLAVSGSRGQLAIWEIKRNGRADGGWIPRETLRFAGHLANVVYFGFTPDGSMLGTCSWDGTSRFWDVVSGREIFRENRFSIRGVSSTGDRLQAVDARGGHDFISSFSPPVAFRTFAFSGGPRSALGVWISPDARLLAMSFQPSPGETNGEVSLWDFQRRVELARVPGIWAQFSGDSGFLYAFTFRGIRRYDVRPAALDKLSSTGLEGNLVYSPPLSESVNTGELLDDGKTLVVAAMDRVLRLDAKSGAVLGKLNGLAHYVRASRDGSRILTSFQNNPTVLRDGATGRALTKSEHIGQGVWSPDTNWIAISQQTSLQLLRFPSGEKVFDLPMEFGPMMPPAPVFSPDSRWLAVAENRTDVRLIEIPSGRTMATFSPPNPSEIAGPHGIEFSRDGQWLVVVRDGGDAVGWNLPTVRSELTRLDLDWSTSRPASAVPIPAAAPPSSWSAVETAAIIAVLLTMLGGLYTFAVQRRMHSNFEQLETVALEQRRKLHLAQTELLHGQKMRALGTLTAGVAHDFNNLLSIIRLSNQLGAEQTRPTGAAKENVEAIESAVRQGESIVHSMLGYSRGAADQPGPFSLDAVVNETVAMLGRKFLAGIILKLEIESGLPRAFGSRSRLEQMLLNLIVNASEAMNGHGELSVRVRTIATAPAGLLPPRPSPQYLQLAVGDSGPGISPEVLPRIFEPFFTTKNLSRRPGTGLGLATVYTMAEQEGCGLEVTTTRGKGTTFCILLPTTGPAGSEG